MVVLEGEGNQELLLASIRSKLANVSKAILKNFSKLKARLGYPISKCQGFPYFSRNTHHLQSDFFLGPPLQSKVFVIQCLFEHLGGWRCISKANGFCRFYLSLDFLASWFGPNSWCTPVKTHLREYILITHRSFCVWDNRSWMDVGESHGVSNCKRSFCQCSHLLGTSARWHSQLS